MTEKEHHADVASIRDEYTLGELLESDLASDPLVQFRQWFDTALAHQVMEPNAMVLSTVGSNGAPSSRVVLLKGIEQDSFVFYTNYSSRKGEELGINPNAALLFFWPELQRQVRIEGIIERVSDQESDAYFASRPFGSKLGALASPQSTVVPHREYLDDKLKELEQSFPVDAEIKRPPHWGGFRLRPHSVEFWQGRASRMHDRLIYSCDPQGEQSGWTISRLAP